VNFLAAFTLLPWDAEAAELFQRLRRQGVRIGSMDLKIGCIALAHDATLLTRNTVDFARVPGLRFENWLD
jgi:tRNA(fMet)-specific endonuclease VapC